MGIAALICGILAVVNCWDYGVGLVPGIVGLILGSKALQNNPNDKKAKVGKTLSLIAVIITAVVLVVEIICCAACGGVALLSGMDY